MGAARSRRRSRRWQERRALELLHEYRGRADRSRDDVRELMAIIEGFGIGLHPDGIAMPLYRRIGNQRRQLRELERENIMLKRLLAKRADEEAQ